MKDQQRAPATAAAVVSGNRLLVRLLISEMTDTYPTLELRDPAGAGSTTLMIACAQDDPDMARMLLGMGVNTEEVDHEGYTALLLACQKGNDAVVKPWSHGVRM